MAWSNYIEMEIHRGTKDCLLKTVFKKTLQIMQTLKQKWPTYKIRLHIPNVANISETGVLRASHSPPFPFSFKTLSDSIRREHKSSLTKRRNINRNFKFFFQFLSEDWHDRARWILREATLVVNERRFFPVEEREDGTIGPISVRINWV